MVHRIIFLVAAFAILSCERQSSAPPAAAPAAMPAAPAAPAAEVRWPPLPTDGFVAGRPATSEDVKAGRAGFLMQSEGKPIGAPLPIPVPQYAFHVSQSGERTPGVIIQAEIGQGIPIYAMRTIPDGALLSALDREFVLLGTSTPSEPPLTSR